MRFAKQIVCGFNRNVLAALVLLSATVACTPAQPLDATAQPDFPPVVAAEPWLYQIAAEVAGTRTQVATLIPPGVDPHAFQPAPQDAIHIQQARVLIVNGLGYETWLSKFLQDNGSRRQTVIVASDGLTPMTIGGAPDPHMWMDPRNVVHYVENIRDGLIKADPAGKDVYRANALAYIDKLLQLDEQIKWQVMHIPPERRVLVTNHDSLGYFAKAYGFQVVGAVIPSVTDESSPSAQQMASLIDTVKRTHAPAIFLDPTENTNLAQQISSATGAKVVTGLYVETLPGLEPNAPPPTYIAMLTHDATIIVSALK